MDAISAAAGVSKQTLYRWWSSKAEIIAEAVLDGYQPPTPSTIVLSGDRDADVSAWLDRSIEALADHDTAVAIRALLSAVATDTDAAQRYYQSTLGRARHSVAALLHADAPAGPDEDPRAAAMADVAISALMFWVLIGEEVDDEHRDALRAMLRAGSD